MKEIEKTIKEIMSRPDGAMHMRIFIEKRSNKMYWRGFIVAMLGCISYRIISAICT